MSCGQDQRSRRQWRQLIYADNSAWSSDSNDFRTILRTLLFL